MCVFRVRCVDAMSTKAAKLRMSCVTMAYLCGFEMQGKRRLSVLNECLIELEKVRYVTELHLLYGGGVFDGDSGYMMVEESHSPEIHDVHWHVLIMRRCDGPRQVCHCCIDG